MDKLTTIELSKNERQDRRRQQRLEEHKRRARKNAVKRVLKVLVPVVILAGAMGAFIWYLASRPPRTRGEILSYNGLHWHPELAIYVSGVKQDIPANIGLSAVHNPIHTHEADGVIHLEMQGIVREDDIRLSKFLKLWGKDLSDFGPAVKMMVNGQENTELESYVMQDKDKVELRYD